MGAAESSAQRDGKSAEDASAAAAAAAAAEVKVRQEEGSAVDSKPLQKNGQISSMTSLNGHSEDNTLAEVGQPDGVSVAQKEEASETMDTIQDEVAPQVNGEKMEKESPNANDITAIEEKAEEEKPDGTSEVGFKKIFRFVGFKFTLKKDKSDEKDPVTLLTVKDKEGEEVTGTDEPAKEEQEEAATVEEKSTAEEKEADTEAPTAEAEEKEPDAEAEAEAEADVEAKAIKDTDNAETINVSSDDTAAETTNETVKEEEAEKEGETTPPSQEITLSPFRKLFTIGLFSNLRKKASIKRTKEEEEKEGAVEEETAKTEETAVLEDKENVEVEQDTKEEAPATREEEKSEPKEEAETTSEEAKSEPIAESNAADETPASATTTSDDIQQEEEKTEPCAEVEKAAVEVNAEAELLSSQEKVKLPGSPLKKLFTGAGLKKLSTKKQKSKKDTEAKLTDSGEQAAEQLQSSTESAEAPKADSGPSSPEESGEHVIEVEVTQGVSGQEPEGEVASDGEKKKEGIIAWSSFKKLVTSKKRVKRSSDSEDEATNEKPAKSATLSSSESAASADKNVEEEVKEDKPAEEESKPEDAEKLVSSTEENKKKMDTSVSWEALMCMGGTKKRTRKTSDSDDEETKIEEESSPAAGAEEAPPVATEPEGQQETKTEVNAVTIEKTENEEEVLSSPEPPTSPPERESAWDTLKRLVMSKNKVKVEEKAEESSDQVQSDSEAPKDESSFSLRKFFPGRRKKKVEKQATTEQVLGEEDSDTPAVVPLSEYEKQEEQEEPAGATIQIKVSEEDRSPSWIPAIVEDVDDDHDHLSDIPEEAENVATPKSAGTDIGEDETEDHVILPPKYAGRRLSTAEVKPVAPAPPAETTPVPQGPQLESAEVVVAGIEAQVNEIPSESVVILEDVPVQAVSEKIEYEPPNENAESKTNIILSPHTREEAMAICTGLGTKEIAKVALEKPTVPIRECVAVIRDALSTDVSTEEQPAKPEEAIAVEDPVMNAQTHQVETTELEPLVQTSIKEVTDIESASESNEPEIEKFVIVSAVVDEYEVIQPNITSENSPKAVLVDPIIPTSETVFCTESVEVIEPVVETRELKMHMEQLAANEENTPLKEIVEVVTKERSSSICEESKSAIAKAIEPAIPVVSPSEELCVTTQAVVLCPPLSVRTDHLECTATSQLVDNKKNIVQEITEDHPEGETVDVTIKSPESETSAVVEQACESFKDDVQQASQIEAQSVAIAQAVIQDAVVKVSEGAPEPKKPSTPTATIPTPVQAVATIEKDNDITTDSPVITDTPVPVICEKPAPRSPQQLFTAMEVTEANPIEVIQSLDDSPVEKKESGERLKRAVEIKVSEETVIVEEVIEMKEELEEEQSKDMAQEDPKAAAVDVKTKDTKAEASMEENKDKALAIHMPVQVVLQTAQVVEDLSVEEEVLVEFDSNGPLDSSAPAEDTVGKAEKHASEKKVSESLSGQSEVTKAAGTEKTTSGKCAEVMAQVIEVIEEAVKEIEPTSTEIMTTS